MDIKIRSVVEDDAETVWQLMYALDFETKYMMYEPDERSKDVEQKKILFIRLSVEINSFW